MSTSFHAPGRLLLIAIAIGGAAAAAQAPAPAPSALKDLTLDDLYDPDKRVDFAGQAPTGFLWLDETHYLWRKTDPKTRGVELFKVEAATGRTSPFLDLAKLEAALAALEGVRPEEARRAVRPRSLAMNSARTALLLTVADDLFVYDLPTQRVRRLTRTEGKEEEATLSPDGSRAAFVRANDLYVADVASGQERRLTQDGSEQILNGKLDWVYQEEIYGRGTFRAYWWSPDSQRLAFLRLDENGVPRYTLVDDIPSHPTVETYPYPKAGDPNPKAKLGVVAAAGGSPVFVDTAAYAGVELLIVDVDWSPDGAQVIWQAQDREQTWLDLNAAQPASGATRTLFRDTTKAWVERIDSPHWLKDGSFLWQSDRTGYRHLYHYGADGALRRPVTSGSWEVRSLYGADASGLVYFSATERSAVGADLYRIKLDGSGLTRLSQPLGAHSAVFSPAFAQYLDTWSDISTPPQVRLHRADGKETRVVYAEPIKALAGYRLSKPEFLQVPTRDGFLMEAVLLKPPDFDPKRKYPVYQHTYGGPHAPQVRNAWGGSNYLFHQLLAQKGLVVWVCDNRTASGKGQVAVWGGYQRMGESELRDIEDGVAWLKKQPWVDASRIGINGWSYGGFMVSYALTHSKSFAMGIAGGSVTDWRNYDSIYTERYMKTPQNNPDGYRDTAPRLKAKDLSGQLLLLHGAIDDNVHPQNTMQFAYELQKAGKPFRMVLYPKSQHGVTDPALAKHLRVTMMDFIEQTLLSTSTGGTR